MNRLHIARYGLLFGLFFTGPYLDLSLVQVTWAVGAFGLGYLDGVLNGS